MTDHAVNEWTRDDLPGAHWPGIHGESERQGAEKALDAVVDHLNAHHPKPDGDLQAVVNEGIRMKRRFNEQRIAREAAEAAEKRNTWPKMTPTGHTYVEPRTYEALCHEHGNAAQAEVECWEADECPPEPTWEMVGIAHREVERLQRDLEGMKRNYLECQEELVEASRECDEWMARAEAAEARTAPAVTREDVEQAIRARPWRTHGADSQGYEIIHVESAVDAVCDLFGVESESADPIEDTARELHEVAQGDGPFIVWEALMDTERNRYRRMAAHVLGQEAGQ